MKINTLKCSLINQNGYHKNILTKERIGTLFIYPIDFTPNDCLACDGYLLNIADYEDLYKVIGTKFNKLGDATGKFRIPDYNITGRFLQPGENVGTQIAAGLPNITGSIYASSGDDMMMKHGVEISGAITAITGSNSHNGTNSTKQSVTKGFNFNAALCSSIYGNSETVQPQAQIVHICIKYK